VEPYAWNGLARILMSIATADPKDYGVCQLCLDTAEKFFLSTANNYFLTEQLRTLDLWKDVRLWLFMFSARLHQSLRKVYSRDIVMKWNDRPPKEIQDFEVADWANMKTQVITLSSRMARMSLGKEFVDNFIKRVCASSNYARADEKTLLNLANSLPQNEGALQEKKMLPPELEEAKLIILWIDASPEKNDSKKALASLERTVSRKKPGVEIISFSSLDSLAKWLMFYSQFVYPKLRVVLNHTRKSDFTDIPLDSLMNTVYAHCVWTDRVPVIEFLSPKLISEDEITSPPPKNYCAVTKIDFLAQNCLE